MEAGGPGWNDPPNLSYSTKSQTRRNMLTKRVGATDLNVSPAKSDCAPISSLDPGIV